MLVAELTKVIKEKQNYLCIGLDTDIQKIPKHLLTYDDPIFEFNKAIIEATLPYCVAYKPNIAFYESQGVKGWHSLEKTLALIPKTHFTIADAKRGDIGNTAAMYAKTFFETFDFDAVTVAPYMGEDSITPFTAYTNKVTIILGLTSNAGAMHFQLLKTKNDRYVFEEVLHQAQNWGTTENLMFVVGATKTFFVEQIRQIIPDHFLLVPGIGSQGGNLHDVSMSAFNQNVGLLVNNTREIIYANNDENFAQVAAEKAQAIQKEMQLLLNKNF